jgi:hypothetical protein
MNHHSHTDIIDVDASPLAPQAAAALAIVPTPRCTLNVRAAVEGDLPFIDQLQKMHSHMVGFLPIKAIAKRIADGDVLIAEAPPHDQHAGQQTSVGYVISHDQYMKRDDVGIIYQLNVLPLKQRSLIGASLIKTVFERAAYGCKLFCCWCAQDIQANWFWESIGFVPLAFRTGSRAKQRIHIFWQRRIRENDDSTPYWFPSKTEGGSVGEDRIVLPIPIDTHWRDAKPLVLPGIAPEPPKPALPETLPSGAPVRPRPQQPKLTQAQRVAIQRTQLKALGGAPLGKKAVITARGIKYIDRTDYVPELDAPDELVALAAKKPKRPRKERMKNDPKFIAAARELRDRYLDEVNSEGGMLLPSAAHGKYDVSRQLEAGGPPTDLKPKPIETPKLLKAA